MRKQQDRNYFTEKEKRRLNTIYSDIAILFNEHSENDINHIFKVIERIAEQCWNSPAIKQNQTKKRFSI
jgi:hypothetical protein